MKCWSQRGTHRHGELVRRNDRGIVRDGDEGEPQEELQQQQQYRGKSNTWEGQQQPDSSRLTAHDVEGPPLMLMLVMVMMLMMMMLVQ